MRATKDHLLKVGNDTGTVDVPDVGEFAIRQLTRKQQIMVQEARERDGLAAADVLVVHFGMVDPAMTVEEVERWQATPGQSETMGAVSEGIGVISGMKPGAGKDAYKSSGGKS